MGLRDMKEKSLLLNCNDYKEHAGSPSLTM